ncbi:hypothetical protein BB561_003832 [Smittium simulii]|uniref:Uncharacterized protein n=1 Tax=Smittium simulii TaxID=133385 RepID=A0A2T9YJB6_9FUNG|nr:hypothetical protein BB561_003832 [Smittium simulii]
MTKKFGFFTLFFLLNILILSQASYFNIRENQLDLKSSFSTNEKHGQHGAHDEKKMLENPASDNGFQKSLDNQSVKSNECKSAALGEYNLRDQFISLVVILAIGALGSFSPILGLKFKSLVPSPLVLDLGKFFGIGVIISTAVIHIYDSATIFLSDKCVSHILGDYTGWAGVIFILGIFLMQYIDFVALKFFGQSEYTKVQTDESQSSEEQQTEQTVVNNNASSHMHTHSCVGGFAGIAEIRPTSSMSTISVILLEASIIFHSVIIGLTLGLTDTTDLLTLTIAIAFHQLFEGFAIGDRIGSAYSDYVKSKGDQSGKKLFLVFWGAFLYSVATPFGHAVGIALHGSLNTRSPTFLITLGVLEAISAGILVYVALVHLLSEEFSTSRFWKSSYSYQNVCFFSMYLGAGVMAFIGKWA